MQDLLGFAATHPSERVIDHVTVDSIIRPPTRTQSVVVQPGRHLPGDSPRQELGSLRTVLRPRQWLDISRVLYCQEADKSEAVVDGVEIQQCR